MSDTLKQLAAARRREAEAKAEVERLTKLAEDESSRVGCPLETGFRPKLDQSYYFVDDIGEVQQDVFDGFDYELARIANRVYETEEEAKVETMFRRYRRDGARVIGAKVRELWYWNTPAQLPQCFEHMSGEFVVTKLLSGNAFRTPEQAERYGKEVLPKIVKELLGE